MAAKLGALKVDYNQLLGEHEKANQYLAKTNCEVAKVRNEADLHTKIFRKALKLLDFAYRMGKAKGVKLGREEDKEKYSVSNPLPRSALSKMPEDDKISLSKIDIDAKTAP